MKKRAVAALVNVCLHAAVLCLFGATHAAMALGREVGFDEVMASHPQQVDWVATCGTWRHGGRQGFYRIVHATLHAQSLLYVQWMRTDAAGMHHAVHTASVAETNNDHAEIELSRLRCRAMAEGVRVDADAHYGHEARDGAVRVVAAPRPGRYRFIKRS